MKFIAFLLALLLASPALARNPGATPVLGVQDGGTSSATGDLSAMTATVNVLSGYGALPAPKCDGTTTDSMALRNILTAAAGHARVLIPTGVVCRAESLVLRSNSRLTIDGTLKAPDGPIASVLIVASGADNVTVDGSGVIDGNRDVATKTPGAGVGGITSGPTASNLVIRDITIQNIHHWPVNIVGATNCFVTNVTMKNATNSAEFAAGSNNCWADRLKIDNIDNDGSFVFYKGVWNSGITNSVISNGYVSGIGVYNDNDSQALSHDIVIANNILYGNGRVGIEASIGTHSDETKNHYNIKIQNNILRDNGKQNLSLGDIALSAIEKSDISGNSSYGYGGASTSPAIKITSGARALTIENNKIFNSGSGGTSGVCFQLAPSTGTGWVIRNNSCVDNQTARTIAYGFLGNIPANSQVQNNQIVNTIGGFGPLGLGSAMAHGWAQPLSGSDQVAGYNFYGHDNGTVTALQYSDATGTLAIGGASGKPSSIILNANTGGKIVFAGAYHDGGTAFVDSASVTPGAVRTPAAGKDRLILKNTSVVASQTIKLPPITGTSGQMFWMSSIGGITALTVQDNDGNAITGSPTTLAAGVGRAMITDGTSWFPAQ